VSSRELCLTVDLGTGGPKIGIVSLDGELLDYEMHSVVTHFGDDGSATQDATQWWELIVASALRLFEKHEGARTQLRAVAVTGQYASTVPVDANGLPTGPCLTWLDSRGGPHVREAIGGPFLGYNPRKVLSFIRKTAGAPSTTGADPIGHMLYLSHEQPELMEKTAWFMEPIDYLTMRFTGIASATHASRQGSWLTDNRDLGLYAYDTGLLKLIDLGAEKLPPLVPFGSLVGTVTSSVATQLGISEDVAVVAAVPDLQAAALGSGGTELYEAHLALSTTSWISCPVPKKKTDINHSIATVPGLSNDSYLVINNQETGAKALEWLQGILAGKGERLSFSAMTALAQDSPMGANGVLFAPWINGERSPIEDKRLRGSFSNLSISTSTADLIRSVMEGVAANSRWLLAYVEQFTKRELSPIRLLGGGAQSALWCQICADALGRPVEQVPEPMVAQLRGAALLASIALGERSLAQLKELSGEGRIFLPSPIGAEAAARRADLLPSLYERDRAWNRAFGKVTH